MNIFDSKLKTNTREEEGVDQCDMHHPGFDPASFVELRSSLLATLASGACCWYPPLLWFTVSLPCRLSSFLLPLKQGLVPWPWWRPHTSLRSRIPLILLHIERDRDAVTCEAKHAHCRIQAFFRFRWGWCVPSWPMKTCFIRPTRLI